MLSQDHVNTLRRAVVNLHAYASVNVEVSVPHPLQLLSGASKHSMSSIIFQLTCWLLCMLREYDWLVGVWHWRRSCNLLYWNLCVLRVQKKYVTALNVLWWCLTCRLFPCIVQNYASYSFSMWRMPCSNINVQLIVIAELHAFEWSCIQA